MPAAFALVGKKQEINRLNLRSLFCDVDSITQDDFKPSDMVAVFRIGDESYECYLLDTISAWFNHCKNNDLAFTLPNNRMPVSVSDARRVMRAAQDVRMDFAIRDGRVTVRKKTVRADDVDEAIRSKRVATRKRSGNHLDRAIRDQRVNTSRGRGRASRNVDRAIERGRVSVRRRR